jgi:hypothetical protein
MNHAAIVLAARNALAAIEGQKPTSFKFAGKLVNDSLNEAGVPFEERRYVVMAMADLATGRANAIGGDAAKLLRKLAGIFLDQHAQWAGVGFFDRRAPFEEATRREIDIRRAEQRELDGRMAVIDRAVEGVENVVVKGIRAVEACGGFLPHTIDARTSVALTGVTGEQAEAKKPRSKRVGPDAPGEPAATTE